jgi:hypothetical protein
MTKVNCWVVGSVQSLVDVAVGMLVSKMAELNTEMLDMMKIVNLVCKLDIRLDMMWVVLTVLIMAALMAFC